MEEKHTPKHPHRYRVDKPWGNFEELTLNEKTTVKILTINPSESLSLQTHDRRSEWWIVLDEAMEVTVGDVKKVLHKGDDIFIPAGTVHRVTGLDTPCRWVEIAYGPFFEHDIERIDDKYGRS